MNRLQSAILTAAFMMSTVAGYAQNSNPAFIEVTGSATLNIIPDRISIEIGMEEYYRLKPKTRCMNFEKSVKFVA